MRVYLAAAAAAAAIFAALYAAGAGAPDDQYGTEVPDMAGISGRAGAPGPALGDADAPLTMIEWGDYQCTYCYRFHQNTLPALKERYVDTGAMRVVFYDFPLNGNDSVLAARASHCAAEQDLYWEYHDILYENWGGERTGWITPLSLYGFALEAGLDISGYNDCMDSGRYLDYVLESYGAFQEGGIDATPSFVVTDGDRSVKIVGNQPYGTFVNAIEGMLQP